MNQKLSFPKHKIKIVLLENIHQAAVDKLKEEGYAVEVIPRSLADEELAEHIVDAHILGIRSKTKVHAHHFEKAQRLLGVGCFGVGTNQVDLTAAMQAGIPVFNAPYGNTRSVAELTMAHIFWLARRAADKNSKMHQGHWKKSAKGCIEVRNKTLGIIGYGHIGQQVGLLAEAVGMHVVFYDLMKRLPLGNACSVDSIDALYECAKFVSLHVPAQPGNKALIDEQTISKMQKGAYLLNLSRGTLVDFSAVRSAIESGHLAGAAIDVYPAEPKSNDEAFECELAEVENVILTPHLGGSTEEAQYNIGLEVAAAFEKLINTGSTVGAVNFPQADLPVSEDSHRILNIHKNVPGVLKEVNGIISNLGANINGQYLSTYKEVGYLIMDVNREVSDEVKEEIEKLPHTLRTRILY